MHYVSPVIRGFLGSTKVSRHAKKEKEKGRRDHLIAGDVH